MGSRSIVYVGIYALIYQHTILGERIVSRDGLPRGVLPSGILKMRKKCPGLKVPCSFDVTWKDFSFVDVKELTEKTIQITDVRNNGIRDKTWHDCQKSVLPQILTNLGYLKSLCVLWIHCYKSSEINASKFSHKQKPLLK